MKVIFKLLKRDFKNIIKTPSVLALILLLCVLPSLYAWISIKASWNPYANTNRMPIGVVNNDSGTTINGKNLNVGNEIVKNLKKNNSINWIFIDDWQGNYNLNSGKYYSLIEIPADFSSKLSTLITASPEKPSIIYKSNEKLNGIATKITDSAKNSLADTIKSSLTKSVNMEALKMLNSTGKKLETDKPQILQLKDALPQAISTLNDIKGNMSQENSNSKSLQQYLSGVQTDLPKLSKEITSLHNIVAQSRTLTLSTKESLNSMQSDLNKDINEIESKENQVQLLLNNLQNINNMDAGKSSAASIIENMSNLNNSLIDSIDTDIKILNEINGFINTNITSDLINSLKSLRNSLSTENNYLTELKNLINSNSSQDSINQVIYELSSLSSESSEDISNISNIFYSGTYESMNLLSDTLTSNLDSIDSILNATGQLVPELNLMANSGISSSKNLVNQRNRLNKKLVDIQNNLNKLSDKMKDLNDENLTSIINIMEKDPNKISDFISSPIELKNVELYNSGLFGYGITPFYTTLAIWVGALLLCSMLTLKCKDLESGENVKLSHKYFAKLLLFLIISIIQTTIITLGDIYIVGIKPENLWLMMGFAFTCSFTFTIIIVTLVSIMGNIGKAAAVIIMVFQIAGAGGLYPVKTLPQIFGVLEPLWPFTYAINGFREAIAGPIWSNVYKDFLTLMAFAGAFLIISVLKKPLHKLTDKAESQFKESGL
ncbi:YhgE/Pip domain-containing protein [Clostridium autoethanogenum]|uniref:YhgE/Pip domain-containing protein n=1 Tax=Clostridium autoethanogenum TaxID=84023 RepID=A0A3M0SLD1_9CLOT|nr:YhgE/Pip domain-containing protein [Clostridium autoethanogenum]RMC98791.1 YhgE/Pip domain-containing protein [Clostridium autoethanogenum]